MVRTGSLLLMALMVAIPAARAEETSVAPLAARPIALWQMADTRDGAGDLDLEVHGAVSLGVPLEGSEREASLLRGGNGLAARLEGGYLALPGEGRLAMPEGAWTISLRLADPSGAWLGPILGSYGSDREVSFALRGVDGRAKPMRDHSIHAGDIPTVESWLFRPGGPRSIEGSTALLEAVWGASEPNPARVALLGDLGSEANRTAPLPQDILNAVQRVGCPVATMGPTDWHDVLVRFTGAKLQLFVDGVLIDEEYPIGTTRAPALPFLIGAGQEGGELRTGFAGLIDYVALWDRALGDGEVAALAGGAEAVRERERAMLGDENSSMQYFRPRGHNRKAGDCIPWWDEQTDAFRLYYLILRRNMHSKWDGGHGGLEIWQATTKDLITWDHHPVTVPITEQWEAWNGTGGVAWLDGQYHWFYPTPCYDDPPACGGIQHAVSTDGVHFSKTTPKPFLPGGDCEVYRDSEGHFDMLLAGPNRTADVPELREKTLVAWVRPADLTQRGGSVLTLEHPDRIQFDGIVLGEQAPGRWMPGSNNFLRTPSDQAGWPEETASPEQLVQVALVHSAGRVELFRDGQPYASARVDGPLTFPRGSSVLIGLRHSGASRVTGCYFEGDVLDARVYASALTGEQIAALRPNEEAGPEPLAWFDFAHTGLRDRCGRLPDGVLHGGARLVDGVLRLRGDGYLLAPGATATLTRLVSDDLVEWTPAPEPFIETDVMAVAMCPHLFRMGGWYYFIGGNCWFRSRGEFGPWEPHTPAQLDNVGVPKTAAFRDGRRIYAGFLPDGGWGGNLLLRELVQTDDGWLGTRFVPEMTPACGEPIAPSFANLAHAAVDNASIRLEAGSAEITGLPADYRLRLEIVASEDAGDLGVALHAGEEPGSGCELLLSRATRTARFAHMDDSGGGRHGGPGIVAVRGLDGRYTLDVVVKHDILDAEIAGGRTLATRFWNPSGDRVRLHLTAGSASVRVVSLAPLE